VLEIEEEVEIRRWRVETRRVLARSRRGWMIGRAHCRMVGC